MGCMREGQFRVSMDCIHYIGVMSKQCVHACMPLTACTGAMGGRRVRARRNSPCSEFAFEQIQARFSDSKALRALLVTECC